MTACRLDAAAATAVIAAAISLCMGGVLAAVAWVESFRGHRGNK